MSNTQFVSKMLHIVENNPDFVNWSEDGTQFVIQNQHQFAKYLLPKYFRHQRFESFIRQLNMYSFHKVCRKNDCISFRNQYFKRGNQQNYFKIQRRKKILSNSNSGLTNSQWNTQRPIVSELITQIQLFKQKSLLQLNHLRTNLAIFRKEFKDKKNILVKQSLIQIKHSIAQIQQIAYKCDQSLQGNYQIMAFNREKKRNEWERAREIRNIPRPMIDIQKQNIQSSKIMKVTPINCLTLGDKKVKIEDELKQISSFMIII